MYTAPAKPKSDRIDRHTTANAHPEEEGFPVEDLEEHLTLLESGHGLPGAPDGEHPVLEGQSRGSGAGRGDGG